MKHTWRIGRVFGIDIKIDSSWIVIFILVTWNLAGSYFPKDHPHWPFALNWALGLLTSLLFFGSVLAHELTHSLVAKKQGEEVSSITLFILGGVAQIKEEPDEPLKEFRMAVVGPLSSFALAGMFFVLSRQWLPLRQLSLRPWQPRPPRRRPLRASHERPRRHRHPVHADGSLHVRHRHHGIGGGRGPGRRRSGPRTAGRRHGCARCRLQSVPSRF